MTGFCLFCEEESQKIEFYTVLLILNALKRFIYMTYICLFIISRKLQRITFI